MSRTTSPLARSRLVSDVPAVELDWLPGKFNKDAPVELHGLPTVPVLVQLDHLGPFVAGPFPNRPVDRIFNAMCARPVVPQSSEDIFYELERCKKCLRSWGQVQELIRDGFPLTSLTT